MIIHFMKVLCATLRQVNNLESKLPLSPQTPKVTSLQR